MHGVGWKEEDGVAIARLILHYDNGQTSNLLIRYGVHVRNWWKEPSEKDDALLDVESLFTHATPVIVAITVGKATVPQAGAPLNLLTSRVVVRAADTG